MYEPEVLASMDGLWYNLYMDEIISFCTACMTDIPDGYIHICDGDLGDIFFPADRINRSIVFPANTFLLTSSRKQGRMYSDDKGVRLVHDE